MGLSLPLTTYPCDSSPLIDRNRLMIIAPHDTPVAVGLAAHHHDMNLVGFEPSDYVFWRRFQLRRVGFFTECRARINVVLYQLVIPILRRGHNRILINPFDHFLFSV